MPFLLLSVRAPLSIRLLHSALSLLSPFPLPPYRDNTEMSFGSSITTAADGRGIAAPILRDVVLILEHESPASLSDVLESVSGSNDCRCRYLIMKPVGTMVAAWLAGADRALSVWVAYSWSRAGPGDWHPNCASARRQSDVLTMCCGRGFSFRLRGPGGALGSPAEPRIGAIAHRSSGRIGAPKPGYYIIVPAV